MLAASSASQRDQRSRAESHRRGRCGSPAVTGVALHDAIVVGVAPEADESPRASLDTYASFSSSQNSGLIIRILAVEQPSTRKTTAPAV